MPKSLAREDRYTRARQRFIRAGAAFFFGFRTGTDFHAAILIIRKRGICGNRESVHGKRAWKWPRASVANARGEGHDVFGTAAQERAGVV